MVVERLVEIAEKCVKETIKLGASQAQANTFLIDNALTRFANSQIHQNVASKIGGIIVKAILPDKRIGTFRANTLEEGEIGKIAETAIKMAKSAHPNEDFKSLPEPEPWTPIQGAFDSETASCTPDYRAEKVREAIETAHGKSSIVRAVAGYFSTSAIHFAVANSLGVSAYASLTTASMKTTVISEENGSEGFGTAEKYSRYIKDINPTILAEDAAEKSVKSVKPIKVQPGEYAVVLSPLAVATIFSYLGYIGFSAVPYQNGVSFVNYFKNQQVFDSKINVKDDARDPRTLFMTPVDGEGVPKKALNLIKNGVVSEESICYDSLRAGKENKKSTGHSFPPLTRELFDQPIPFNIIVEPGDSTVEEMIRETRHGIFVTYLHYVNPVEPAKAILTGLTRDGTFLIENGEITKPIVNMRFTDSMLSALKDVPLIGKNVEIIEETTAPPMKLNKLRFVGISAY
ncbi:TldD/PmbA family protein [Candidatus Bathyarchaeota archaeon]|nr:TldD/PmbA family protein [Candidatus Bathyarchaeota archaeon]